MATTYAGVSLVDEGNKQREMLDGEAIAEDAKEEVQIMALNRGSEEGDGSFGRRSTLHHRRHGNLSRYLLRP